MFNDQIKRFDFWDIGLIKLSVASAVLFILAVLPEAMDWVSSIHWGWFLAAAIIFAIRPQVKFWKR